MATILERIQYGYDRDSRRTWRRRALTTGMDYFYKYDGLGQVVASNRGNLNLNCSAIAAIPDHAENWNYDPTGNWHGYWVEEDGSVLLEQDRHHDKGNRLTEIVGETPPFELDRVGRVTLMAPKDGNWDVSQRITWDAWGRIKRIEGAEAGSAPTTYSYDGLHRRIVKDVDLDITETYYSNTWKPLEERRNGLATPYKQFLWGARHRDDLVRQDRSSSGGFGPLDEVRYVLMDYYSPAAVVDEAGEVTARYDFAAFGVRRTMAPDFSPGPGSELDFSFQGQFLDWESGLLDYGYRYYSPHLGRWMSKDPLSEAGGDNLYANAENDALNKVDILGLCTYGEKKTETEPAVCGTFVVGFTRLGIPLPLFLYANCKQDYECWKRGTTGKCYWQRVGDPYNCGKCGEGGYIGGTPPATKMGGYVTVPESEVKDIPWWGDELPDFIREDPNVNPPRSK